MLDKKGDLSVNIIIIAAIGMLVLIVLVVIFSGRTSVFTRETIRCETQGGVCADKGTAGNICSKAKPQGVYTPAYSYVCVDSNGKRASNKICCIPQKDDFTKPVQ